jgi:tRNA (guanosine-2'-O-)-methyltransferase
MKRTDPDVFSPPTRIGRPGDPAFPDPGPSPGWTASGVIETLSPLVLPERLERLRAVLAKRLDTVTVLLDNPGDPHNVAAVLRSADAFGVQTAHVFLEDNEYRASGRVAQGSHYWVDTIAYETRATAATCLTEQGYTLIVTHPEGELLPSDLGHVERPCLILGNEHSGVHATLEALATTSVRIPMVGFVESLNVSVSAALLLSAATAGRGRGLRPEHAENLLARWLRHSVPRSSEILAAVDAY